jgi:uncharacterized protein (TIGR02466 family)
MATNTTNSKNIEVMLPHSPYLYKAHFNFNWEQLKPICEMMVKGNARIPILKNGKSSYTYKTQPHEMIIFSEFYEWLMDIVKPIAQRSMGLSFSDTLKIANSWVNVQENGGHTTEHNHAHVFLGVAAYLHMPEGSGYFECKDPLELLKSAQYHESPNWAWKEIPTVSGDVLIFPSWLIHRTQENKTNEERWVLTSNIIYNFQ